MSNRSSILAAALLLLPLSSAMAQDVAADESGSGPRSSIDERLPGLTKALDAALVSILTTEAKIEELTRPVDKDGKPIDDLETYQEVVFRDGGPFMVYMQTALKRFDLHEADLPSIRFGADLVRFDAGYQAAQALVKADAEMEPGSIMALFTPEFVEADPIWGTPMSRTYHTSGLQAGQLAPLGNGGALGYLAWGLLQDSSIWSTPKNDREAFILELLARGFETPLVARTVSRALTPPMIPARKSEAKTHPGRGVAGPLVALRGKVGFTQVHEARLEADLAALVELEKQPADGAAPKKYDHLKTWLPEMLALVRFELYPADYALRMRHGATLLERRAYWQQLFRQHGFVEGRLQFLREIEAIMAGADAHPNTQRIDELLAMQAAASLLPGEEAELARLTKVRDADRDALILDVTRMMALSGTEDHYELLVQTLMTDLSAAFGDMPAYHQEVFLERGWNMLAVGTQPKTMQTLADHLTGDVTLPPYAVMYLVATLTYHDYDGRDAVLTSLVEEGSPLNTAWAIQNSQWASDATLAVAADRLIEALAEPGGEVDDPIIVAQMVSALKTRKDQVKAKAILMKTFESGLWMNPEGTFAGYCKGVEKAWVRTMLSDQEVAQLVKSGKLLPGLF